MHAQSQAPMHRRRLYVCIEPSVSLLHIEWMCERRCVVNGLVQCAIVFQNDTTKSAEVCDRPSICLSQAASATPVMSFETDQLIKPNSSILTLSQTQDADLDRCCLKFHKLLRNNHFIATFIHLENYWLGHQESRLCAHCWTGGRKHCTTELLSTQKFT